MADASLIWNGNWAWSLPLIVLTVTLHVICLGVINTWVVRALHVVRQRRQNEAFELWFSREASDALRNIPAFRPRTAPTAAQ